MDEIYISFHNLINTKIRSDSPHFTNLLLSEFRHFIVKDQPLSIDLEWNISSTDFNRPEDLSPFFDFQYKNDTLYFERHYKFAKWKALIQEMQTSRISINFTGNKLASIFLIGELFEPLMRWALIKKKHFLMHSSCVSSNDQAFLFSGIRHTGKTFLMLHLLLQGAKLLSDDYTFVSPLSNIAYAYPKKVNFFKTHFQEISALKSYWKDIPLKSKLMMHFCHYVRKLTNDHYVLGYQRYLDEIFPNVSVQNQVPIKKIVILTRKPSEKFSVNYSLSPDLAANKLICNNQWEAHEFHKMMLPISYEGSNTNPTQWLETEANLIREMTHRSECIEIIIPDFSENTVKKYQEAASRIVFG